MSLVLERGGLGLSWQVAGGRLKPLTDNPSGVHLDCAWSPKVELRPGAVNAHTHLYSGLASLGMPPPVKKPQSFLQILERVWWRLDRALDAATLRASARYALAEALLAGTTTLIDHHESPNFIEGSLDVLADAAQELGVRVVVGYGATGRNFGEDEERRGLAECDRFLGTNKRPLVRGLVALHASFTVSDGCIRAAGELARARGTRLHVHVAEDGADVGDAKRRGYAGPLERLLTLRALPAGSLIAHGVHLDEEQVLLAEAEGLWLLQNPRSNEGNAVGYPKALKESRHVALGTDGWPAEMDVEAAALYRLGRANGDSDELLSGRTTAGFALAGGLFGEKLGALEAGAAADVVVGVPGEKPRHVIVNGKAVVLNGKLVTADLEVLREQARQAAAGLWKRMEAFPEP